MTPIHDPQARLEAARLIVARGCECDAQENCGRDPAAYCGCRKEAAEILALVPAGSLGADALAALERAEREITAVFDQAQSLRVEAGSRIRQAIGLAEAALDRSEHR